MTHIPNVIEHADFQDRQGWAPAPALTQSTGTFPLPQAQWSPHLSDCPLPTGRGDIPQNAHFYLIINYKHDSTDMHGTLEGVHQKRKFEMDEIKNKKNS